MLFNSFEFLFFLPVIFFLYWFVFNKSLRLQNFFILVASYFFYGWWDWRFLSLIFISSLLDFNLGKLLSNTTKEKSRKYLLWLSLVFNLGMLAIFKYFNFFAENFEVLMNSIGLRVDPITLSILLPVGISFYTFQTLSYTIDVYNRKLTPSNDWIAFFAYVSFFPQLVAGPIERAKNLLPQFDVTREFRYPHAVDGCRQILWGFFKKVVIADNCAYYVNEIFANYNSLSSPILLLGAVLFAFQIYGDFSGYSDIAIGTARLFGFKLMQNFAFPYFSRDIAEFWRRWHISLSSWFRDYVYFPLGGSRGSQGKAIRNIFVIFLVSGFWHGANWTFILWGFLNAAYFLPQYIFKTNRKNIGIVAENRILPNFREFIAIAITFLVTSLTWVVFRAESIGFAFDYYYQIFNFDLTGSYNLYFLRNVVWLFLGVVILLVIEWMNRTSLHGLQIMPRNLIVRRFIYLSLILIINQFWGSNQQFIYFQF